MAAVRPEFIIERQGRKAVLYAGLLEVAHGEGLKRITTKLVQIPSEENGQMAIAWAEVETERGVFSGIGDAGPSNVARAMLTCTIRMAETRAKARALRDAINVGVVALEELDEDVDTTTGVIREAPPAAPRPTPANQQPQPPRPQTPTPGPGLATPAQINAIYSIGRHQHSLNEEEIDARSESLFGVAPTELTRKQASDLITALKGNGR